MTEANEERTAAKRDPWRERFVQQEGGGLTVKQFCE
jgi:hypothetical protein